MARRKQFPYALDPYDVGPIVGCRDLADPAAAKPELAERLLNVYPDAPPGIISALRARPAFVRLTTAALGSGSALLGQGVFQHTRLDGSEYSFAFFGGRMYRYDWSTGLFTDKTPASVAISTTNPIHCATFNDRMIVSDGANRPWKYDAASSTASFLTDLTYALYGPIPVHYGKLFGVKDSDRNLIIWSEENDPDTGYENALYLNRWRLGQTDQEGIEALTAENSALYYFRQASIGIITGAVTDTFATDGTTDGVSTSIGAGAGAGAAVVRHDAGILFVDQHGRPNVIGPGDVIPEAPPFWGDAWKTLEGVDLAELARARTAVVPKLNILLVALLTAAEKAAGATRAADCLAFDVATGRWLGRWRHALGTTAPFAALGILKDAAKQERLVYLDDRGHAHLLDLPTSTRTQDRVGAVDHAIPVEVALGALGYDPEIEQLFDELTLVTRPTARSSSGAAATPPAVPATLELEDPRGVRTPALPLELAERTVIGTDAGGRYVKPIIASQSATERFTFTSAHLKAIAIGSSPESA